jgi:hypothetical protein
MVMLSGVVNLTESMSIRKSAQQVRGLLMLLGAFNDVPERAVRCEINFGSRAAIIQTLEDGTIYLQGLVRCGG